MKSGYLRLENEKHNYFVQSAVSILNGIGYKFTVADVEKLCEDGYFLCIKPRGFMNHWWIGIWAVGNWGIKYQCSDGEISASGYDVESKKPETICVYALHDWNLDKNRPSYAEWRAYIEKDKKDVEIPGAISKMVNIIKHPLNSYYDFVDYDNYSNHHTFSNKFSAYMHGWLKHFQYDVWEPVSEKCCSFIECCILKTVAMLDPRVVCSEMSYNGQNYYPKFDISIGLSEHQSTPYKAWKLQNMYESLYKKLGKWLHGSLHLHCYYYRDDDPEYNKMIKYRGTYWSYVPEKDAVWQEEE